MNTSRSCQQCGNPFYSKVWVVCKDCWTKQLKGGANSHSLLRKPNESKMPKKYIVYIEQVNQTFVEVTAEDEEDAREKGYAKWRREEAHSRVMSVEECDEQASTT